MRFRDEFIGGVAGSMTISAWRKHALGKDDDHLL
jgi:hypothetical protein